MSLVDRLRWWLTGWVRAPKPPKPPIRMLLCGRTTGGRCWCGASPTPGRCGKHTTTRWTDATGEHTQHVYCTEPLGHASPHDDNRSIQ